MRLLPDCRFALWKPHEIDAPRRADFPAWRMPFPTLPTLTGRRKASRRAWLAFQLEAGRISPWRQGVVSRERVAREWVARLRRAEEKRRDEEVARNRATPWPSGVMAEYARIMASGANGGEHGGDWGDVEWVAPKPKE